MPNRLGLTRGSEGSRTRRRIAIASVLVVTACGASNDATDGPAANDAGAPDASEGEGAESGVIAKDAASNDAAPSDGATDAIADAGSTTDASLDGATMDAASTDAAPSDSGQADATVDAGPVACTGAVNRYAYFLQGNELHWIAPHGNALLVAGITPTQVIGFPEAVVDATGHASQRRTTELYVASGRIFRVDGASQCTTPPVPKPLSTLTNVAQICRSYVVSDFADPSHSQLIFEYGPPSDGPACGGTGRPTWSIPLGGDATTAPTSLVQGVVPAITPMGTIDAALISDGLGAISRVTSLTNPSVAKVLVPADLTRGALIDLAATWIGDGRYLLSALRANKSQTELYVYDATTDTASTVRGYFSNVFSIKPTVRDATYLYFAAAPFGGQQGIWRLARDGSADAQLLTGSTSTKSFAVDVVGVLNGALYFTQLGTTAVDVLRQPTSIDFAAPPAAASVVKGVSTTLMLSSNHLFYRPNANFISAVALDGSNAASYQPGGSAPLAAWAGCSSAVDLVDPVGVRLCDRALALVVDNTVKPWQNRLVSFDATAGGDVSVPFFASATRDEQQLASWAGYSNLTTTLENEAADPFFRVGFDAADLITDPARFGIVAAPGLASPANTQVFLGATGVSYSWLR